MTLRGEHGGDDVETTARHEEAFEERLEQIVNMRLTGASRTSCAVWVTAVMRANREGRPCPTWPELEAIAPYRRAAR